MSKFNSGNTLADFGTNEVIQIGQVTVDPHEELPPEILGAILKKQEAARAHRAGLCRDRLSEWDRTLGEVGKSIEQILDERELVTRILRSGELPIRILQTEILIRKSIEQIQIALERLNKSVQHENGTPVYSEKNLDVARITTLVPGVHLRELTQEIAIIDGMGNGDMKRLLIHPPEDRSVFLATESVEIPPNIKERELQNLIDEAKEAYQQFADGTQMLTLADLSRMLLALKGLYRYFKKELDEIEIFKAAFELDNSPGTPFANYFSEEEIQTFQTAFDFLKRTLSYTLQRMTEVNSPNNKVLMKGLDEEAVQRFMRIAVRKRRQMEQASNRQIPPSARETVLRKSLELFQETESN
ncbi:hypothetical protein KJ742_04500 [Patescibacteria group bacterium]|nr:hypothetical protein [Patescibacteria group bacterium]MBU1683179.1 hypothetical protein [Patescibacteria group bacterium]MBU1934737.1 hypothetical protein [Patescibacteria group bacterium]